MEQSTITSDFRMLVRTVTSCFVREQEPTLDLMQCESHMGDSHQSDNHGGDSHGVESHGTCKRSSPGKYYVVSKVIQDTESVVGSDTETRFSFALSPAEKTANCNPTVNQTSGHREVFGRVQGRCIE